MNDSLDIVRLRILVGYLGERTQLNWWHSSFLSPPGEAFLAPVFGKSAGLAKVVGVTEAARRVHDAVIGVGRACHLFRLPEATEEDIHRDLMASGAPPSADSVDAALRDLSILGDRDVVAKPGPMCIGAVNALRGTDWIALVASHYRGAFGSGVQSLPYFAG
ncbi:MAG: BrxE family protein [Azospirillum sp.]|nr:BrxE family protein [Azospirillum sp.]